MVRKKKLHPCNIEINGALQKNRVVAICNLLSIFDKVSLQHYKC